MRAVILTAIAATFAFGMGMNVQAATLSDLLPSAGMGVALGGTVTLSDIYEGYTESAASSAETEILSLEEMNAAITTSSD
jgi:hypothetical protein